MIFIYGGRNVCDNKSDVHDPILVAEGIDADRYFCKNCKANLIIKKDYRGVYDLRESAELFKRYILQGTEPLFYKVYPRHLRT